MSSALLWIGLPAILGVGLLFYRRQDALPLFISSLLCVLLIWVAWQIPIDVVMQLGPFSFEIAPTLILFGRSFTLTQAQLPFLAFLYLTLLFWVAASYLAKPTRLFLPVSLIVVSLLVAALAVEPFLYAAPLIAMAALLLIPVLVPVGTAAGPGVQRYFKFQIFAVPFLLFTGWILSGVEASPGNIELVYRAGLLLGLGFAFLLAIFPFHSWLPMLAAEAHPYTFGYLAYFLPTTVLVFAMSFFDRYVWLRDSSFAGPLLLVGGGLAAALAGGWAAFESRPSRLFAYALMAGIAFGLQAVGLGADSARVLFAILLPQAFAAWGMALGMSKLTNNERDSFRDWPSLFGVHPLFISLLLLAFFSAAGLPVLAGFPGRVALLDLAAASSPPAAIGTLLGGLGLTIAGLRMGLALLPMKDSTGREWVEEAQPVEEPQPSEELSNPYAWGFLTIAALILLGFGLLPNLFLSAVPRLAAMFSQLAP